MLSGHDFNSHQRAQQTQFLKMRGAQIAEQKAGQKTELGTQQKATGSKNQLIGTIVGIVAVFAVLVLLAALNII